MLNKISKLFLKFFNTIKHFCKYLIWNKLYGRFTKNYKMFIKTDDDCFFFVT